MDRAARLHAVAEELRRAGSAGRTAARLARTFEVTPRTIKRDIAALQAADVPIVGSGGPGGGYVMSRSATLPPVNFTTGQAMAIAIALTAHADGPFADDGRAALAKLVDVLDTESRTRLAELADRVWVREDSRDQGPAAVRRAIDRAVAGHRVVSLTYRDRAGQVSQRLVEPQLLARTRGQWYVLGWCRSRDAPRWFRLDRVTAAAVTATTFVPRPAEVFGEPPEDAGPVMPG